jgi:hypothetical protein
LILTLIFKNVKNVVTLVKLVQMWLLIAPLVIQIIIEQYYKVHYVLVLVINIIMMLLLFQIKMIEYVQNVILHVQNVFKLINVPLVMLLDLELKILVMTNVNVLMDILIIMYKHA